MGCVSLPATSFFVASMLDSWWLASLKTGSCSKWLMYGGIVVFCLCTLLFGMRQTARMCGGFVRCKCHSPGTASEIGRGLCCGSKKKTTTLYDLVTYRRSKLLNACHAFASDRMPNGCKKTLERTLSHKPMISYGDALKMYIMRCRSKAVHIS